MMIGLSFFVLGFSTVPGYLVGVGVLAFALVPDVLKGRDIAQG
jgi:hypothetical protein